MVLVLQAVRRLCCLAGELLGICCMWGLRLLSWSEAFDALQHVA